MSLAISTATVTVNAAFFQEIKEVNEELWQLLDRIRRQFVRPQDGQTDCRRLVLMLGELRDQIALHFALEEAYGYFDDPAHVDPQFCEQAVELRAEHRDLYLRICDIVDRAERCHGRGDLTQQIAQIGRPFHTFDRRLQKHEQRENDLIQMAYDSDLGGGD